MPSPLRMPCRSGSARSAYACHGMLNLHGEALCLATSHLWPHHVRGDTLLAISRLVDNLHGLRCVVRMVAHVAEEELAWVIVVVVVAAAARGGGGGEAGEGGEGEGGICQCFF